MCNWVQIRKFRRVSNHNRTKQGDALSHLLIYIVLEVAVGEVQAEYQGLTCGLNISLLVYADNDVILDETEQDI